MADQRFSGVIGLLHRAGVACANAVGGPNASWRRSLSPWVGRALHAATFGRGVATDINGATFRIDPRHRVFMQPDYESPVASFLRERVRPGHCCLDVGAHVGVYALQLGRWVSPGGRVVAFEPHPGTAEVLRRHLRMNRLESVVTVEAVALGARHADGVLFGSAASGMSRLRSANPALPGHDVEETRVTVLTMDEYCGGKHLQPDWIVIDVEGLEMDVLSGATRTLEHASVVAEFHPDLWVASGWSREAVTTLLSSLGLRAVGLTGQRAPLDEYGVVALERARQTTTGTPLS